mmetsp:Transcript_17549/g.31665  ORF Transcript_17549/g.31665 Transcript_17549/m.31665 type:complete len:232 (-) Transcript_17549:2598-3293(-)
MVTVDVLRQNRDARLQSSDDLDSRLGVPDDFDKFLHRSSSVGAERHGNEVGLADVDPVVQVFLVQHLDHLLAEVVPEGVNHQLHNVRFQHSVDSVDEVRVTLLQLLLQNPAPHLVLCHSVCVVKEVAGVVVFVLAEEGIWDVRSELGGCVKAEVRRDLWSGLRVDGRRRFFISNATVYHCAHQETRAPRSGLVLALNALDYFFDRRLGCQLNHGNGVPAVPSVCCVVFLVL